MKINILLFFFVLILACNALQNDCNDIRQKMSENMKRMESAAKFGKQIQQQDCILAKSSVKLTRKFGQCVPTFTERAMNSIHRNMRSVAKVICENVNKRFLNCFSNENLKQFNSCTNKTFQYLDYLSKQNQVKLTNNLDKKETNEKKETESDTGLETINVSRRKRFIFDFDNSEVSGYEHACCVLHLKSDCFLSKVLHSCADGTQLRMAKIFQTFINFVVRDMVDVVCGRFDDLNQCKQFAESNEDDDDLGFR